MNGLTTFLSVALLCAGINFSPQTWIKELLNPDALAAPKYQHIQFWDAYQKNNRGFRALFYTVPLDRKNRLVDQRLNNKMVQFLSSMCQDVVTLDSIDNPTQKAITETVLSEIAEQWKVNASVDPKQLFQKLPFLDVDLLIFMERTKYEQFWNKDKKYLLIGINAAVFELDFGQPLYNDQLLMQVPWFGEKTSYDKAEHTALLKVADAMGERMNKAAQIINNAHAQELQAAEAAQQEQQNQEILSRKQADQEYRAFIDQVEKFLKAYKEPKEFIALVQGDLKDLKKLLKKPTEKITPEDITARNKLKAKVANRLDQYQKWLADQQHRRQNPVIIPKQETRTENPAAPSAPPAQTGGSQPNQTIQSVSQPQPYRLPTDIPTGNLFDRRWLIPDNWKPAPTPIPSQPLQSQVSQPGLSVQEQNAMLQSMVPSKSKQNDLSSPLNTMPAQPPIPLDFIHQAQLIPESSPEKVSSPKQPATPAAIPLNATQPQTAGSVNTTTSAPRPVYNSKLLPPVKVTNQ